MLHCPIPFTEPRFPLVEARQEGSYTWLMLLQDSFSLSIPYRPTPFTRPRLPAWPGS